VSENDDELMMVLIARVDGRSVDRVTWEEARARLVAHLTVGQSTGVGHIENAAEDILCALWSGDPR
jgi:hypothetical protein